jgi:hypothetical protein
MPSNDFENLQSVYLRTYNKLVKKSFRADIDDDDFATPESQMRNACLIKDSDTATMMVLRSNLFYIVRGEARALHPPIYGLPAQDYHESVKFKPQVIFLFQESREDASKAKRRPKTVRASFRLNSKTTSNITQADIDRLTTKIKGQFPATYRFKTGRIKASYRDKDRGLELVLSPYSTNEAKTLITKLLSAQGVIETGSDSPDWTKLSLSQKAVSNFDVNEYVRVLGKRKALPKRRPVTTVSLRRVELFLHGQL